MDIANWSADRWIAIAGLIIAIAPYLVGALRSRLDAVRKENGLIVARITQSRRVERFYRDCLARYRFGAIVSLLLVIMFLEFAMLLRSGTTQAVYGPIFYVLLAGLFWGIASYNHNGARKTDLMIREGIAKRPRGEE